MNSVLVGNYTYFIIHNTSFVYKVFDKDELQEIVATLIDGYEKDGDPKDLWDELFTTVKSFTISNDMLEIKISSGTFKTTLTSDNLALGNIMKYLGILNEQHIHLKEKLHIYESILSENNLLNKKYKPSDTSMDYPTKSLVDLLPTILNLK